MLPRGDVMVRAWKGSGMGSGSGERGEVSLRMRESEEEGMLFRRMGCWGVEERVGFRRRSFYRKFPLHSRFDMSRDGGAVKA